MQLQIKYFGLLSEITQRDEEIIDFSKSSISELLELLYKKYPSLENKDFQVAQNHQLVSKKDMVSGHEFALLPPFSGG